MVMTKEEYDKQRRLNNPEYWKQYKATNYECRKEYDKLYNESLTSPFHIVYLLPFHNYVGVTNQPYKRMKWHKRVHKRNTDNWTELAKFDTREEALKCEAEYHSKGYEGAK